jgi:hypothetical protein
MKRLFDIDDRVRLRERFHGEAKAMRGRIGA